MSVDISVLMLTYNKSPFLSLAVPALFDSMTSKNVEFLLLDNGSTDDTPDVIERLKEKYPIKIFRESSNIGLNGYSVLAKETDSGILVTQDDDVVFVSRGWEEIFRKCLRSRFSGRMFGYVSTDTINYWGRGIRLITGLAYGDGITIEIGPAGGWFAAVNRVVLEHIGGFHHDKPLFYLEDADIGRRMLENGLLFGTVRQIKVYHANCEHDYVLYNRIDTYNEKIKNINLFLGTDADGLDI